MCADADRATSALLAVLMGVTDDACVLVEQRRGRPGGGCLSLSKFGRTITGRLGAPAGTLDTYLEVAFRWAPASSAPTAACGSSAAPVGGRLCSR